MSEQSRVLPVSPSLRYLKIEAKRRRTSGEFTSLHDAQLAIAREHGKSSWASLKDAIDAVIGATSHAFAQVKWVIDRFRDAESPDWLPPTPEELQEHFEAHYLGLVPAPTVITTLRAVASRLQQDVVVEEATADRLLAQISDLRIEAATQHDPPYLLTALRIHPVALPVTDYRVAEPPTDTSGVVSSESNVVSARSFTDLGLVGLVVAGGTPDDAESWSLARGWADLDRPEPLRTDHRFPAQGISKLVTATAVLRLVAQGLIDLDRPANDFLRLVRLADERATVRELLAHTAGVVSPRIQFAARVPDQVALLGPIVACTNERGIFAPSNGGYSVLGQLIAEITGLDFSAAATSLVLEPLGMGSSAFPTAWPVAGAVTGYNLTDDGSFEPSEAHVSTMPAAGGLWTTASDLVRFGLRWASILPDDLSEEALRPQLDQPPVGAVIGLGWLINQPKEIYGHPGAGPGGAASLLVHSDSGAATAVMTNRTVSVEPVNARLIRPIA